MTIKLVGSTSGSVSFQAPASTTGGAHRVITLPDRDQVGLGRILQVVHVTKTDTSSVSLSNSSAYYDVPGLTASITPASTSNKILVDVLLSISVPAGFHITSRLLKGSTPIAVGDNGSQNSVIEGYSHIYTRATNGHYKIDQMVLFHQDSPNTTSATTYKINIHAHQSGTAYINKTNNNTDNNYNGTAVSAIRLMEVAA